MMRTSVRLQTIIKHNFDISANAFIIQEEIKTKKKNRKKKYCVLRQENATFNIRLAGVKSASINHQDHRWPVTNVGGKRQKLCDQVVCSSTWNINTEHVRKLVTTGLQILERLEKRSKE